MNLVILAGGQGSRLWPMSRQKKPKQFYNILSDNPMIVDVYNRLLKEFPADKIFISTMPEFVSGIKECLPGISDEQFLVEPCRRDCGPARAWVSFLLAKRGLGDEPMAFIATDHFIGDEDKFLQALKVGSDLIEETGKMLDISVTPRFPNPALGYTKIGDKFRTVNGIDVFSFLGHTEKPDYQTAVKYTESGQYLWHANYYMWTPNKFLEAYKRYAPDIYDILLAMDDAPDDEARDEYYGRMPTIMFDRAVTEKMNSEDVLIIRGDFGWSDIGSWDVLHDRLKLKQEEKNVIKGEVIDIDSDNCLIYSKDGKLVAAVGLQDFIVVDTDDALLICPRSRSQEVKKIVQKIKDKGLENYL